jgi:hypothetical protein
MPEYKTEITVEMYLEDKTRLKCLVTETLPFSSATMNKMINHARVIFSDGIKTDTLSPSELYDYESGRSNNYASENVFFGDSTKIYSLKVIDSLNREVSSSIRIPQAPVKIDQLVSSNLTDKKDNFTVGVFFTDPGNTENYYRIIVGKGINNYTATNTDVLLSDVAFDGKAYSFTSKAGYEQGDTVTVRLYTLLKEHYDYLQSIESAQDATYNPFVQPVRAKTNIVGGEGIFTAIRYDEKKLVIR